MEWRFKLNSEFETCFAPNTWNVGCCYANHISNHDFWHHFEEGAGCSNTMWFADCVRLNLISKRRPPRDAARSPHHGFSTLSIASSFPPYSRAASRLPWLSVCVCVCVRVCVSSAGRLGFVCSFFKKWACTPRPHYDNQLKSA